MTGVEPKVQIQEVKEPEIKEIQIPEIITIKELAEKIKIQPSVSDYYFYYFD